jgi:hypothetical protein
MIQTEAMNQNARCPKGLVMALLPTHSRRKICHVAPGAFDDRCPHKRLNRTRSTRSSRLLENGVISRARIVLVRLMRTCADFSIHAG